MSHLYLAKINKPGKAYTKRAPFFRLLSLVYLADSGKFNLVNDDNYKKIKEEVHDEVFSGMLRRGLIKDASYRLDFDAIFHSVLVLTEANEGDPVLKDHLYPLEKFAEDMGYAEGLFKGKFKEGSHIGNILKEAMMNEINIPGADSDLLKIASEKLNEIEKRNGRGQKGEYNRFWDQLYTIQVVELIKITLGLDIWDLDFAKDATRPKGQKSYTIDIDRHHLEKDKALFTIFQFSKEFSKDSDFTKKLVPLTDYVIGLAPLMQLGHKVLDRSSQFTHDTQLAIHRLMHLYELIQRPLIGENFDYQTAFSAEFRARTAVIDGEKVLIWDGLKDGKIKNWVKRWEFVKKKGSEAFFLDNDIGYPNFYKYRYKQMEGDFKLFLAGKNWVNKGLFHIEANRNAFWEWFLSTYLKENKYPII